LATKSSISTFYPLFFTESPILKKYDGRTALSIVTLSITSMRHLSKWQCCYAECRL